MGTVPRSRSISSNSSRSVSAKALPAKLRLANWAIGELPGLSEDDCAKLIQAGILTTRDLLRQTRTIVQKQALAAKLEIHIQHVNKWSALADLSQLPEVGCQHCGLLLHAGVASVEQLAKTSLPRLHQQILKLQVAMMQRKDLCPGVEAVAKWIQQAKVVSHACLPGENAR